MCKALDDIGVVGALHQHTGTCVETRDETYAVMEAVDTRYVKFGPDVGQLQKGGSDPVKVVKDFLPTDPPRAHEGLRRRRALPGLHARSARARSTSRPCAICSRAPATT